MSFCNCGLGIRTLLLKPKLRLETRKLTPWECFSPWEWVTFFLVIQFRTRTSFQEVRVPKPQPAPTSSRWEITTNLKLLSPNLPHCDFQLIDLSLERSFYAVITATPLRRKNFLLSRYQFPVWRKANCRTSSVVRMFGFRMTARAAFVVSLDLRKYLRNASDFHRP